jgi:Fatty acid desaturase
VNLRREEFDLAHDYVAHTHLESLSPDQMKLILDRGRALFHWYREHLAIHYALNFLVLVFLIGGDYLVLLRLPSLFLAGPDNQPFARILLAAIVCGSLHSWLLYSTSVFSMHEGAAHKNIFPGTNPASRALNWFASNLCRIAASEPHYYSQGHMSHHARFGTEADGEFLNFVLPRRYWLTLLPFAAFLNYTDFLAHRPPSYTKGRIISATVAVIYELIYAFLMAQAFGWTFVLLTMLLFLPHVGFFLDRLRQFTEHNLMPLENKDGSRSFGFGFWGMLIGGGPWGSPCHWEHHLVASLPWYQQLALHAYVKKVLTPEQKKQFMLEPVIGFPKLLYRMLTEPTQFVQTLKRDRVPTQ